MSTAVSATGASLGVSLAPEPLRRPRGLWTDAAKYWAIIATNLRNQLAYLGEAVMRSFFLVMILFVFLQLWQATYASQERNLIGGFTLAQMIWYLALTESIILSRPRLNRVVDEEIRSGDIAYTLVRPYSYAGFRFANYLAERCLFFVVKLIIATGLALIYVGPVPLTLGNLILGATSLLLAIVIDFLFAFGIALLAFWTENTSSINLIYDRLVMLLGGMLLPVEVFPEPLASVARALPFASLVYAPARLALGGSDEPAEVLFAKQIATAVIACLAVAALYRAALRRVTVNGG
ncbi:MAG TPA: ABC-2 family transporter protein [Chloroflexota bacterium]|nr:ABC-2 family transporter protein [Chloroflexota bacterium]